MTTERRWAIIASDGRHTWLGRNSDPSHDEIARAEEQLSAQGVSAWLAIVAGDYWSTASELEFLTVRALAGAAEADWEAARQAFLAARQERLAGSG